MSDPSARRTTSSSAPEDRTDTVSGDPPDPRRWKILALLGVAQLMVVLDATIVNIALPSAQRSLGFSDEDRQWIITAYALSFGSLLLLGGRLGDLFGRKWTFIGGLIGFALASAIGGFSQSFGMLVAARALQGVFGALLAPSALSLLTETFSDPKERAKAFGIFGAAAGGGGSIGLLLGGVLTETLSWRWCLYVNLLIAGPAAFLALRLLINRSVLQRPRIDVPGVLTASLGAFAVVYGLSSAADQSWTAAATLLPLGFGVVLLSAFVVLERRVAHPLLPLHIVTNRGHAASYVSIALAGAGIFALFFFLTFFLQQNLGYSPTRTGLAFLPMTAAIVLSATTVQGRLLPRVGPKPLVVTGMVLGALAMLIFTRLSIDSSYLSGVLPGLVIAGAGLGCVIAPSIATATSGVAPQEVGVASAMVNTSQQIGGSVGTALLSSFFAGSVSRYTEGRTSSPGLALEAAVQGYAYTFWFAAGLFALGLITAIFVFPNRASQARSQPGAGEAAGVTVTRTAVTTR